MTPSPPANCRQPTRGDKWGQPVVGHAERGCIGGGTQRGGLEFSKVRMQGSNQLEISSGDSNTLKIRGGEHQLEPPPFVLDGDTLYLGASADGRSVADLNTR